MGLFEIVRRITGEDSSSRRMPEYHRRPFRKSISCWQPMPHGLEILTFVPPRMIIPETMGFCWTAERCPFRLRTTSYQHRRDSAVGTGFRLTMSVGERGREATLENALSRSARYGLSMEHARAIVQELVGTVSGWREHFEECGVSHRQVEFLAPSFAICDG